MKEREEGGGGGGGRRGRRGRGEGGGHLAAATSVVGRESQLADVGGRSGAAYRAVLPGDLHVVVRVVDGAVAGVGGDDGDVAAAAAGLRELARLRHPNILPLLGYCIAGQPICLKKNITNLFLDNDLRNNTHVFH